MNGWTPPCQGGRKFARGRCRNQRMGSGRATTYPHPMSREPPRQEGAPYPSESPRPVDEWSLGVFAALREWCLAEEGAWTWWEPGYLLFEITSVAGRPIEPALLWTSNEEVTVSFGYCKYHLPENGSTATEAAMEAADLIQRWITDEVRTLVFWNEAHGWCGTFTVTPEEDVAAQIPRMQAWLKHVAPTRAELRTAHRESWQVFRFVNGCLAPL
jgi:hypothetical protein